MISVVFFKYFSGFSSLFEHIEANFRVAIEVQDANSLATPSVSEILLASRYSNNLPLGLARRPQPAQKTSEYQRVAAIIRMETSPIEQSLRASTLNPKFALPIKNGDTLKANIIKIENNTVELQIGHEKVLAKVSRHTENQLALLMNKAPQTVSLRVIQSAPEIVLKILTMKSQTALSSLSAHGRELLPKQQPLQVILNKLSQLNLEPITQAISNLTTKGGAQPAVKLFSELPTHNQLTHADGLKTALKNSGLFYEHGLATVMSAIAKPSLDCDFKFRLLAIQQTLKKQLTKQEKRADRHLQSTSGPLQALKLIDAGLARIEILQITNQLPSEIGRAITLIELPLNFNGRVETIEARIEHPNHQTPSEAENMPISFQLTIPISETEAILARLIKNRAGISITLWSENPRVLTLLEDTYLSFAAHLKSRQDCHLNVAVAPVENTPNDEHRAFSNLISEKI